MKRHNILILILLVPFLYNCSSSQDNEKLDAFSRDQLNQWNKKLTDVIVSDIFTPPVASRIYVYPHLAAYESLISENPDYFSFSGQLKGLDSIPAPRKNQSYYYPLASIIAFSTVAQHLVYNQQMIKDYEQQYLDNIRSIGIKKRVFRNSVEYGRTVAEHIIKWASEDGYIKRQSLPRYVLLEEPGKWIPTPPDYMPGIEPHWDTMRPLVIDSAGQFQPPPPTAFDTIPGSKFYQETMEVYETVNNLDDEKIEIAKFWDCNPNISFTKGHVMFYHQQISPGGHWLEIASIATKKVDLDIVERSEVLSWTAIALYDAFISCWDEKYRSSLIRPETYIYRYIDPEWKPVLQTPAFPEYTSGHSVISASAATVLTNLLGDNFSFVDSSEVDYGLPVREYNSFYEASNEAAISRLYGGIHYRPAIDHGVKQGKEVGQYIIEKVNTRRSAQALK